jgi:anaerobic ribonucleoside-triphosphate reductase activating protein
VASLEPGYVEGLTVLGGEPLEPQNQRDLLPLLKRIKTQYPEKDIWMYTGDVYEELINPASPRHTEVTEELLSLVDVLVDGPFVEDLKDITLRFRGSSNQRLIDLQKTRTAGAVVAWHDDPVFDQATMGPRSYELKRPEA